MEWKQITHHNKAKDVDARMHIRNSIMIAIQQNKKCYMLNKILEEMILQAVTL